MIPEGLFADAKGSGNFLVGCSPLTGEYIDYRAFFLRKGINFFCDAVNRLLARA